MEDESRLSDGSRHTYIASGAVEKIRKFIYPILANEYTFFIFAATIIGFVAGLANFCFVFLYETLYGIVVVPFWGSSYILISTVAGGGVLFVISLFIPSSVFLGYGFPKFLEKVNLRYGALKLKDTLSKALGAIVTLGFGGSAGQEGPIAQIGGGVGSLLGQTLKSSRNHSRIFIACGVASAIAATFNAPIAGVLFAEEIALIKDFRIGSFMPIVIASAVGTMTSRALRGNEALFTVPPYQFAEYREFLFYAALGLTIGLFGALFIKMFYFVKDRFAAIQIPASTKPLIGGILVGIIAIFFPYVLGNGYEHVEQVLSGQFTIWIIIGLIVLKPLATSITLGSGWPGGVFAPSIFIGTVLGGAFGKAVSPLLSTNADLSSAYATIGMGAFLAAVTQAPLTSIFLIFELTQDYQVVVPIMICSVLASAVTRFLCGGSLEGIELKRMGIDIEEGFERNLLRSIRVEDVMIKEIETIREDTTLRGVIEYIPKSTHTNFPVVDSNGLLTGIISLQDFREWIFEEPLKDLIVAKELATLNVLTVTPEDTLDVVLDKWGRKPVEILPVVDKDNPKKILGVLSRRDVITAYNKLVSEQIIEGGKRY